MKKKKIFVDMQKVNSCLPLLMEIRGEAIKTKNWGQELSLADFAKAMLCLNPQSSGGRIDKRLSEYLNLIKSDNLNRGDRKSANDEYFEWKGSLFTSSNSILNLVQIRPWQDINYILYVFDMRNLSNVQMQFFFLSKEQMELEIENCKISSAHGTKDSNANHDNIELALRIEADSDLYKRWVRDYGISLDNLFIKLNPIKAKNNGEIIK